MYRLCTFAVLTSLASLVGCGPSRPGPIVADVSITPSTAHTGDSITARISVTNRGLEVHIDSITYRDTVLSGDDAGASWSGRIDVSINLIPKQSTQDVWSDREEVGDFSEETRIRVTVTVYSDGGEDTDEVVVTWLPALSSARRTSREQNEPVRALLGSFRVGAVRP
jgi:hypothetical protein